MHIHYRLILSLSFLIMLLVLSTFIVSVGETVKPIFKTGDYFIYRMKVTSSGEGKTYSGEATFRLEVIYMDKFKVGYMMNLTSVKGDDNIVNFIYRMIPPTGSIGVCGISMGPEEITALSESYCVSPSYSGEYRKTFKSSFGVSKQTATFKYVKGVLLSAIVETELYLGSYYKTTINIDLIETSVPGLITSIYHVWLIVGITVGIIGVVIALGIKIINKRKIKPPQPTTPAPTSSL